jgi:hypothetical protein
VSISEEDVRDFCSLLSLADRVFVVASAEALTMASLFQLSLDEFGFTSRILDLTTVRCVQPADTVVALCGPDPDPALKGILKTVIETQAVLLTVAMQRLPFLRDRADAEITVSSTRGEGSMAYAPVQDNFDFMALVALHAIRRDLIRRRHLLASDPVNNNRSIHDPLDLTS